MGKKKNIFTDIETAISTGTTLTGDLTSDASMRVDGTIYGRVEIKGDLIVGEKGLVRGDVDAENVLIAGRIEGNISIRGRTVITPLGALNGDVVTETFVVEEGGRFEGRCSMMSIKTEPYQE